ncbi:MAG: Ig domain-containing protein [Methanobacteriaceae archaeon]|nr:Ig domain-containing protein [Methanobacteriaceae archaeon]
MDFWIQVLIILGAVGILGYLIKSIFKNRVNMRSHHKIQAIGLLGLTTVAVVALVVSIGLTDNNYTVLVGVASAAVGAIGGFLAHKDPTANKTALFALENQYGGVGKPLKFTVAAISTAGYNLNYTKASTPELPETVEFNQLNGQFSWIPKADEIGEYNVTFTVSDAMGGSDSRTIKITISE